MEKDYRAVMLRAEEVAERLATTTGHLANMRSAGRGPRFYRFGASVRYMVADVEAYVAAHLVEPVA